MKGLSSVLYRIQSFLAT
ncbi:hypothetical protein [Lysinibacillus macroides]